MSKPWVKNASNLIVVNSILATLAGILVVLGLQDKSNDGSQAITLVPIMLLAVAFWLFALTAEGITTAIDEQDVKRYVSLMIAYNLGVILLFSGTATIVYSKYHINHWITIIITVIFVLYPWIWDLIFLLCPCNKKKFKIYLDELDGIQPPEKQPGRLTKMFYRFKGLPYIVDNALPHSEVYTRLAPSTTHGIGVFAIRNIPKDTNIFSNDEVEMVWINKNSFNNIDDETKKLYEDFCVIKHEKYGCPKNFNMLTVGWYLNESKEKPNVRCTHSYDFIALRDINKGEELLVDYSTYSDNSE